MKLTCTIVAELDEPGDSLEPDRLEELAGELEDCVAGHLMTTRAGSFSVAATTTVEV